MAQAADCLEAFVAQEYPSVIERHDEWPIHLRKGLQKASGWIDMLIQTPKGWVIIDHKSFPGKEADWLSGTTSHLPQLQTYEEAIYKATGKPVYELGIHMPIVGAMSQPLREGRPKITGARVVERMVPVLTEGTGTLIVLSSIFYMSNFTW